MPAGNLPHVATDSAQRHRRLDQVLAPEFTADIEAFDLDELRRRRNLADEVETELSYYRRLLHGRMDLLAFEQRRRRGEELRSLIEALPEILVGRERGGQWLGASSLNGAASVAGAGPAPGGQGARQ
jgi:hypothetical protein